MKRIVLGLVAMMMMAGMNAQQTESYLEKGQRLAKAADESPQDWKKQYYAASHYLSNTEGTPLVLLGEKYANRTLEIAQGLTVQHDTILGKTLELMSALELIKKDYEKMLNYYDQAIRAYVNELGEQNAAIPPRIAVLASNKFILSQAGVYSNGDLEAIRHLREAFWINQQLPEEQRANGMDDAETLFAISHEYLIAEQMNLMKDKVWQYIIDGKKYIILALDKWTLEQPYGLFASMSEIIQNEKKGSDLKRGLVLMDEQGNITELFDHSFQFLLSYNMHDNTYVLNDDTPLRVLSIPAEKRQQIVEAFKEFEKNGSSNLPSR